MAFEQPAMAGRCGGQSGARTVSGNDTNHLSESKSRQFWPLLGLCRLVAELLRRARPNDLVEFERITRHVQVTPNEALFTAGQIARSVHNLTAGVARLYKLLPDGRRQVIGFALPGDFLGTAPPDRYSYSADAIDSVSVCRLSREAFTHFIEHRPHFLIRINEFASRELMLAQEQMLLLGRRTAEEKVASFLVGWRERLAHIGDERQTIALPMSRQDIADYLGLTIETVSRTLTRFEREKMLIIVAGGVRLLDATRAAAMAAA